MGLFFSKRHLEVLKYYELLCIPKYSRVMQRDKIDHEQSSNIYNRKAEKEKNHSVTKFLWQYLNLTSANRRRTVKKSGVKEKTVNSSYWC